jgi:ABC-2 type transport system permease protein
MRLGRAMVISKYLLLSSRGWVYVGVTASLIYPILWLVLLRVVGNPQYLQYFVVGTVVNTSFLIPFIGTAQDMAHLRRASTRYTVLYSNGADHWDIALGYVVHMLLFTLPSIVSTLLLLMAILGVHYSVVQVVVTLMTALVIVLTSSLLGYALGIGVKNYRITNQVSQVITWPLLLLAPVYYPITILPQALRLVSLALPTTYMALAIHGSLVLNPVELFRGLLGLLVYSSASILIARYAIIRGEVNG